MKKSIFCLTLVCAMMLTFASAQSTFPGSLTLLQFDNVMDDSQPFQLKMYNIGRGIYENTDVGIDICIDANTKETVDKSSFDEYKDWALGNMQKNLDDAQANVFYIIHSEPYQKTEVGFNENAKDFLDKETQELIIQQFSNYEISLDKRILNAMAVICGTVYEGKDYEINEATQEMLDLYDSMQINSNSGNVILYVGCGAILVAVCVFVIISRRKHNEKNNRDNMSA